MGIFSKTCEYGLRAVFFIAQSSQENKRVGIKEIAENIHSPEAFLGKILQNLSRAGIIRSMKGPGGGFYLDAADMATPLSEVVKAIDGDNLFVGCGMGLEFCSEQYPCPLHHEFKSIRNSLSEMLQTTTVGQFNDELIKGKMLLTKNHINPDKGAN
ncbi:RrF2 family transcriptional regulator [Sphingobacterium thalpophilum]|uniref:HTH-type transcriptional repressor NsrR n=1 Tax=Sphingobacterium thalpophilum TaxID=259 RepID=A0A4U9W5F3_9SPHI|nr:Rrf2 family transcriptional regulator [Sphingobacterium thalpophilum]VTR53985.1 HTH-type transcriptional repressor NsrR [Sphingobacterium thalpophilum]